MSERVWIIWTKRGTIYGMKTTVEIDIPLLKKAKAALGSSTIKDTVNGSLREVVRRAGLEALADALGTIPIDLTVEQLRARRKKRAPHGSR